MKQRIQSCKMLMGHEGTTSGETMIKGDILYFSKGCVVSNISFQSYKNIISTHYIISSKNTKIYRKHDSLFHFLDRIFLTSCIHCHPQLHFLQKKMYSRHESQLLRVYPHLQTHSEIQKKFKDNYLDA